ncbi:Integral membrane protein [Granulibacter bethesdensis CGDNIH4]|nr:Integral membrane protein [Granulibacter bethesdensis CGDNIH4]
MAFQDESRNDTRLMWRLTEKNSDGFPVMEAIIIPHRSLSRRGLALVCGGLCLLSGLGVLFSLMIHAWPVAGFAGLEAPLAIAALLWNARAVRQAEIVTLSGTGPGIAHIDARGRSRHMKIRPGWLRLRLKECPGRVPQLILSSRDGEFELARSLGEDEKRALAETLQDALYRVQNPVFDNPQLVTAD